MRSFILTAALIGATPAFALGPLKEVTEVREGLIATGMAIEISEVCDDLRPRMLRGIAFLDSLKAHARRLGYTDDQIDDYVDDRTEKDRLEAEARSRLASMGAVEGDPATYCAVGRAEIEAGSQTGRLLR